MFLNSFVSFEEVTLAEEKAYKFSNSMHALVCRCRLIELQNLPLLLLNLSVPNLTEVHSTCRLGSGYLVYQLLHPLPGFSSNHVKLSIIKIKLDQSFAIDIVLPEK